MLPAYRVYQAFPILRTFWGLEKGSSREYPVIPVEPVAKRSGALISLPARPVGITTFPGVAGNSPSRNRNYPARKFNKTAHFYGLNLT